MNIYVSHSTKFNFKDELYAPILASDRIEVPNNIILPHVVNSECYNSKELFANGKCDLMIVEASIPSLGVGIELGWANANNIPILCVCKRECDISLSLYEVVDTVEAYDNYNELIDIIVKHIDNMNISHSTKFDYNDEEDAGSLMSLRVDVEPGWSNDIFRL